MEPEAVDERPPQALRVRCFSHRPARYMCYCITRLDRNNPTSILSSREFFVFFKKKGISIYSVFLLSKKVGLNMLHSPAFRTARYCAHISSPANSVAGANLVAMCT